MITMKLKCVGLELIDPLEIEILQFTGCSILAAVIIERDLFTSLCL